MKVYAAALLIPGIHAFGTIRVKNTFHLASPLYLKDSIAEMIDEELYRLDHKDELKREKEAKSTILIEKELPTNFEFSTIADVNNIDLLEMRKDKRLAFKKPEAYCADRCLSTGHCDVYEDFLEMSVKEVLAFCEECVLSDHDEPCDVPEKLFEAGFELKP